MRYLITIAFLSITSVYLTANAQAVLLSRFPQVTVKAFCSKSRFQNYSQIEFDLTIVNTTDSSQELLFDSGKRIRPWGTFAHIISMDGHDTVSAYINYETLSSTIYSESQLREKNEFQILKTRESITRKYKLSDIAILKDFQTYLPKGNYTFYVTYYGNMSNKVHFIID